DPDDLTTNRAVTASDQPVAGATVRVISQLLVAGPDGRYQSGPLQLTDNNAPTSYGLTVEANGYWLSIRPLGAPPGENLVTIRSGQDTDADFALVPRCTASISGTVVFGDTGQPVTNRSVRADQRVAGYQTQLDSA